jgi:hypothetical protein
MYCQSSSKLKTTHITYYMSCESITQCRLCANTGLVPIISLGDQKITSRFPNHGQGDTVCVPINIILCDSCGLVQLEQTSYADDLYKHDYGYESGISNTMRTHLTDYNTELLSKICLNKGDTVLDIGSNDATTLKLYDDSLRRVGCDPTGSQFFEHYSNGIELISDYFTASNFINRYGDIKCKIVTSIAMFYDLPNPVQFARDVYDILDDNGIWTCEQSYLLSMLKTNSLDTICHEHLEYYALTQIKHIADQSNFKIIDVKFNSCNGGSFRVYMAKKQSHYKECCALIDTIVKEEQDYGINNPENYTSFVTRCNYELRKLTDFIDNINTNNQTVQLYGASTKGNCILQYCNIGPDKVQYAVERNPKKVGKETSTGIEIISEDQMRHNPPNYLIVLPWHFRDEIVKREAQYLDNGGQLIFYFPTFEVVSNKKKR